MAAALSPASLLLLPPANLQPRRPLVASVRASAVPGDAKRREAPLDSEAIPQAEGTAAKAKGAAAERSGLLTAEKARVLRRHMRAIQNWRDAMYHSAIATRLASPDEK